MTDNSLPKTFRRFVSSIALCLALAGFANGDIVISLNPNGDTTVDTGAAGAGKIITVYIGQDASSSDALLGHTVDFDFSAGVVTGGTVAETGSGAPAGFFGAGNLNTSNFNLDGPTTANVDQEFSDGMQPLLNAPLNERWFELELDTTGLANGTYTFQVRDASGSFIDSVGDTVTSNQSFSFSVTSVPEPGSVACLMLVGVATLIRRRR
ncbi:MAG: PEP-CTERM sorting domain-containing protein [Mariniblastus sp.]